MRLRTADGDADVRADGVLARRAWCRASGLRTPEDQSGDRQRPIHQPPRPSFSLATPTTRTTTAFPGHQFEVHASGRRSVVTGQHPVGPVGLEPTTTGI